MAKHEKTLLMVLHVGLVIFAKRLIMMDVGRNVKLLEELAAKKEIACL